MNAIQTLKNRTKPHYILYIVTFLAIFLSFSANSALATDIDYSVTIEPSLTLTIPTSSIVLNLDPSSKIFDSKNLSVSVGTNNKTGYKLTLSTPNDNTDLERDTSGDTTAISATIPTLDTGTYTESTFTANKWGYKINSNTAIPSTITSDYIPFVSGNTLMESDTAVNHDETELTFAAKIDYLQPAGAYNTTLQFNIVANPLVTYIQNLDYDLCTTDPMLVVDKRDGEEYIVRRLADDNCWMMDNLRLDPSMVSLDDLKNNTNATNEILNYFKNGGGSAPYAATAVSSAWISSSQNSYVSPYINTVNKDLVVTSRATGVGSSKAGVYYNICAASAGSYCYAYGSFVGDIKYDICPAGWHMPSTNFTGSDFQALYAAYSSNSDNFRAALDVPLSGYWLGDRVYNLNTAAPIKTTTRVNNGEMYHLYDQTNGVLTIAYDDTTPAPYGEAVRCLLTRKLPIHNMQDVTPQIVADLPSNAKGTLTDTRDGQQYTVAKINGNLWMTQNLAIGCSSGATAISVVLKPTDSNVASDWNTPTANLSTDDYINPRMVCDTTYGAWYNYVAATAGDISGSSNITRIADYDICPAGWRLPTHAEQTGITSYAILYKPVLGGYWRGGSNTSTTSYGWQWSSEYSGDSMRRYLLRWNGSSLGTDSSSLRSDGNYVRCIAK